MFDIDFEKVGRIIKDRRESLNYTQADLADMVNSTSTTIGSIENAKKKNGGNIDLYVKIAVALDLSLDELFNIEHEKNKLAGNDEKVFSAIKIFLDVVSNNVKFSLALDHSGGEDYAGLNIDDIGIAYYIQEYKKRVDAVENINDKGYREKARELFIADFDKNITSKLQIVDRKLSYKPEYDLEFYIDWIDNAPEILTRKIQKSNESDTDFFHFDNPPF